MTDSLLELVNLTDKRDSYVDVLSRGMKQRLCLARALIHDPRLLILDEPASGMDPRARAEMKGILRTLKDMGKTVLISSHILPELSEMCDSLTIIDHGRLVFSGSVEELGRHMSGNAPIRVRLAAGAEADAIEAAVTLIRQYPGVTGVGARRAMCSPWISTAARMRPRACSNSSRRTLRWWTSTARPSTWKRSLWR